MIGNEIYFQDQKNGYLWVNYGKIWSILSDQYSLSYEQIRGLVKIMVEIPYGLGSLTPKSSCGASCSMVEIPCLRHYHRIGVINTKLSIKRSFGIGRDTLRIGVINTGYRHLSIYIKVEIPCLRHYHRIGGLNVCSETKNIH